MICFDEIRNINTKLINKIDSVHKKKILLKKTVFINLVNKKIILFLESYHYKRL